MNAYGIKFLKFPTKIVHLIGHTFNELNNIYDLIRMF